MNEAFSACKRHTLKLFKSEMRLINVYGTTRCTTRRNNPAFDTDPCCNSTLALTQCCPKHDGTIPMNVLKSVKPFVAKNCIAPQKVTALLGDSIDSFKQLERLG